MYSLVFGKGRKGRKGSKSSKGRKARKSRGRKSRGRKGRKSHFGKRGRKSGRKSRGRKSGRKSRGRKSGRKSRGRKSRFGSKHRVSRKGPRGGKRTKVASLKKKHGKTFIHHKGKDYLVYKNEKGMYILKGKRKHRAYLKKGGLKFGSASMPSLLEISGPFPSYS